MALCGDESNLIHCELSPHGLASQTAVFKWNKVYDNIRNFHIFSIIRIEHSITAQDVSRCVAVESEELISCCHLQVLVAVFLTKGFGDIGIGFVVVKAKVVADTDSSDKAVDVVVYTRIERLFVQCTTAVGNDVAH